MGDLRSDVRAEFEKAQGSLGDLRGAPDRVLGRAMAARQAGPGQGAHFVAGLVAGLIAISIIATFTYVRAGIGNVSHGGQLTKPSLSAPVTTPPVAGGRFWSLDADLLDASNGWVLFSDCVQPMTGLCHYSVARTADGGVTWSKAVRVGPGFDPANGDAPRHVHFLNPNDGFVYGGSVTFATHDNGRSWKSVNFNQAFFSVFAGEATRAWVVTYPCAKGVLCPYEVRTSVDAGRTWGTPHALPLNFGPSGAIAFGSAGLLISSDPPGDMALTLDGGATWSAIPARCRGNVFIGRGATADGNELWQLCMDYPDPTTNTSKQMLFWSGDGGSTWAQRTSTQVSPDQASSGYIVGMTSSRPGTLVVGTNHHTIAITHDSGLIWKDVGPEGLGFIGIQLGAAEFEWATAVDGTVWVSEDGGDTWTQAVWNWRRAAS